MLCARILDDPEIGQCGGRERTNDNDSSCQKLRFHRFPLKRSVYSSPLSVMAGGSSSSRNLRSVGGPGQFPRHKELSLSLVVFQAGFPLQRREALMNNVIYLVGLIVVVLAILSFFGLR